MSLFRLALRSHRTGAIVVAAISGLAGLLNGVGFIQIAGTTPLERHAFAAQMEVLGKQLSYLLPAPIQLDTVGGYLTWRSFSTVAFVYAIWALLAGTGAARGDEERGLTETWLAAGISRLRLLLTRCGGFATVCAASILVGALATQAGTALVGEPLDTGAVLLEAVLIFALALVGFGIGVAVSQLVITRRSASSLGAVVLVGTYVLNSMARSGVEVGGLAVLSPFYLFDRSTPLLAGGTFNVGATVALVGIAAVLVALAAIAFVRRDVGGSLVPRRAEGTRPTQRPSRDPLLRLPVLAAVDQQRWWIVGWAVGISALAYLLTSLARTIVDSLTAIPSMRVYMERLGLNAYSDFIGAIWFSTALLILTILVVVQVSGWAADDADGRLESMLAAGASRTRVVLERIAALLVVVGIVAGVSAFVVALAATSFGIPVPGDRLALATILMLPAAFAFAAIGHALVGWRPRVAVFLLGAVAVYSYFIQEFAPIFEAPAWLTNTSFFALYGTPMTKDNWGGSATLVAVGVAATAVALVSMRRRDVGT
jgi:ABC-2 type transport system permease protein